MIRRIALLVLLSCTVLCPAPALAAMHTLLVVGLGGDDDYRQSFEEAASSIEAALRPGVTESGSFQLMLENGSSRTDIIEAMASIAENVTAQDTFVLMLLGHGSYDGELYRFNVKGPDFSGVDLEVALQGVIAQRQLVVVASSASGVLATGLESPGRLVITATKSGGEINAVNFHRYWADALTLDSADVDHDELLSVREAFDYAQGRVESHFENEGLMATEHPRLVSDPADHLILARLGSLKGHDNNPQVNRLLEQRASLELEFRGVRQLKPQLSQTAYLEQLETVLLKIAKLQQDIDKATGWVDENG